MEKTKWKFKSTKFWRDTVAFFKFLKTDRETLSIFATPAVFGLFFPIYWFLICPWIWELFSSQVENSRSAFKGQDEYAFWEEVVPPNDINDSGFSPKVWLVCYWLFAMFVWLGCITKSLAKHAIKKSTLSGTTFSRGMTLSDGDDEDNAPYNPINKRRPKSLKRSSTLKSSQKSTSSRFAAKDRHLSASTEDLWYEDRYIIESDVKPEFNYKLDSIQPTLNIDYGKESWEFNYDGDKRKKATKAKSPLDDFWRKRRLKVFGGKKAKKLVKQKNVKSHLEKTFESSELVGPSVECNSGGARPKTTNKRIIPKIQISDSNSSENYSSRNSSPHHSNAKSLSELVNSITHLSDRLDEDFK